ETRISIVVLGLLDRPLSRAMTPLREADRVLGWVWQRGVDLLDLRARVNLMHAPEPLRNRVQSGIVATLRLDFRDSGQNVIQVCPGSAMSLAYQVDLTLQI